MLSKRTQENTERYIALMAFKNGPDNPAFTSVRNKDTRSTESKAFFRSMNATYSFPPFLLQYFSVIADKVYIYIWSIAEYLFLNPAWASTIFHDHPFTWSVYFVNQLCSTCLPHSAMKSLCNCLECLCLLFNDRYNHTAAKPLLRVHPFTEKLSKEGDCDVARSF